MDKIKQWALPAIQALFSVVLMIMLVMSGLFPGKYLALAAVVVAALLLVSVLLARSSNSVARLACTFYAIFMSGMLVFAMVYVNQVTKTLNSIAGSATEVKTIAVLVEQGNAANSIEETSGYRFGVYEGTDGDLIGETIEEVKAANSDAELQRESYDSPIEMAQDLIEGKIDAAICNKAYTEILDEVIVDFSSAVRVLYEKEFETETDASGGELSADGATGQQITSEVASHQGQSLTDHAFTILISGIDVSGPISATSRSDVNILMTVNPLTHQILLTTTPRDYYVYLPGISGDMRDKLTHAGIYGVKCSMRTLENLYGIEISDYIRINFDSLIRLVDALDGVDVYSDYEFEAGGYYFSRGTNHLDGEEALAFARERHSFDSGDRQRGKNQMLVLTAIIDKLQSPALLKNPSDILEVVRKSMQTSMNSSDITDMISWQLDTGEDWKIDRQSVDGTGDSQQTFSMKGTNLYVMWPDEESVESAAEKIREVMEATE